MTFDDQGAGPPVLYFHGGGDSRASRPPQTHGVRLVAVDRCGERVRGRTLRTWADDVVALADDLQLERFAVVGWSAGGPHALAVAAAAPERVTRVALVASMPPPDGVDALPADVQMAMRLARRSPRLAAVGLERWGRKVPDPTGDPEHDKAYARGRDDAFRHGGMWLAQELAYLGLPWDFELRDVKAHVTIWYGDRDRVTPPRIGRAFAERLPDAELRNVDATHQVLFSHWREILADVAQQTRP
ncbi:MAG TPA: alpha/beta hydrolase [Gaiellaceae bacterium]|nr:alpha/beta hydrolase [Gaiellaceae bacterium]